MARAHADVPRIASLDDIVQSLHSLLDGSVIVEPMAYHPPVIISTANLELSKCRDTDIGGHRRSRAEDASDCF